VLFAGASLMGRASSGLSEKEVEKAISLGRANKIGSLVQRCSAVPVRGVFFGGFTEALVQAGSDKNRRFDVTAMGARGRIATAAWLAAEAHRPFTRADVTVDLLADELTVSVTPHLPDPKSAPDAPVFSKIAAVTLRVSTDANDVVLSSADDLVLVPYEWKSQLNTTVSYDEARASFGADAVRSLPSTDDRPVRVSVKTDSGELACALPSVASLIRP
jgi:hypothetical protein